MRGADPGGEDRDGAPDVVHRRAQPGRDLPGLLCGERQLRRFDDVVLVLVVLAHDSIVLLVDGLEQSVQKHRRELCLTGSHPHSSARYLGKRPVRLIDLTGRGCRDTDAGLRR